MNRFDFNFNAVARASKSVALIAILGIGAITVISASKAKNNPSLGSVSSPLCVGTNAAPEPSAFQPNYAQCAVNVRHWDKKEVTVHINTPATDDKTPQEVADAVAQSIAIWNGKIGSTITLKATTDTDADVDIDLVKPGTLSGSEIGLTQVRFLDQTIVYAQVQVNEKLTKTDLVQAVAHELGHALGIQGHSDDRNDLMYPYAHLPAQITDRDMNTFRTGYGQPAATSANSLTIE